MAIVSAAYVDLSRVARCLDALAFEASHVLRGPTYDNFLHVLGGEKFVVDKVLAAATKNPAAFAGAPDAKRGQALLSQTASLLAAARDAAKVAPKTLLFGHDARAAQQLLKQAAMSLNEGHRLLGGTRPLPELERSSAQTLPAAPTPPTVVVDTAAPTFSSAQKRTQRIIDATASPLLGLHVTGQENIPKTGPIIVTPNHGAFLDPVDTLRTVGEIRPARLMAAEKAFIPGLKGFMQKVGIFPVKRGEPEKALALSRTILTTRNNTTQPDGALVMYPEGWRVLSDANASDRYGAAQLALETHTPIVPIGSYGQKPRKFRGESGFGRRLVTSHVGKPIDPGNAPATQTNIELLTERISREKEALTLTAKQEYFARRQQT